MYIVCMEFLVPRIPVHLLFSYISVVVTTGLLVLVLATPRRQTTPSFIALALTMALWQFAKLVKNGGLPFWHLGSRELWSTLSFVGATFVYPSLFSLSLQLSGRRLKRWRWQIFFAITSAIVLVVLYSQGFLTEGLRLERYGYFNKPKLPYLIYTVLYTAYMVWGIALLSRKPPERLAMQYPSRILFWAATLGFGFGSLEFYSIWVEPIYPLADLSSAFYSAVFYWAIFRFNYMGGRSLLLWVLLYLSLFCVAFILLFGANLSIMALAPWFERPWVPALLIALISSSLVPLLYKAYSHIRQIFFPVQHSGRDLLLHVSSLASHSGNVLEMSEQVLTEVCKRFGYSKAALILFRSHRPNEKPPHIILKGLSVPMGRIHTLQRPYQGALSRRELLDGIRQFGTSTQERRRSMLREFRILRSLGADILVPSSSEEGLELVMLIEEGRYRTEDWSVTAPLLEGVCKILADHLYLRRMNETRIQERHLGDLGLMAAGLAHEIKNPLEGIYGAAQLLQEENKGNSRFVNMVLQDSMRLNDIVHSFLKFARPWPVQMQNLDLPSFLNQFISVQSSQGISIQLQTTESHSVQADPGGLQQILVNLIQNAWRAQPKELPLRIQIHQVNEAIEILVQDDGPGVPADQRVHLFKPFYTTASKGNGLGLAMSRKIAQAMGGDLYFVSTSHGATFAIRLLLTTNN